MNFYKALVIISFFATIACLVINHHTSAAAWFGFAGFIFGPVVLNDGK